MAQTYYDQYNQCYKNILTVNIMPPGPIKKIIRRIKFPKLSYSSHFNDCCNPINNCGLAFTSLNYGNCCDLMTPNEIPELIAFLLANGYQIETQITNMLNNSTLKISNKKLAFTVTYYENTQPNITYMR
jgi:hypothetical protein